MRTEVRTRTEEGWWEAGSREQWSESRWGRLLPCGVWCVGSHYWRGDGEVSSNLLWFTTTAAANISSVCINGCCLWLENDNDWLTLLGNTWGLRQTIPVNYISIVREGLGCLLTDQCWFCLVPVRKDWWSRLVTGEDITSRTSLHCLSLNKSLHTAYNVF